jgi:hypothetical protein
MLGSFGDNIPQNYILSSAKRLEDLSILEFPIVRLNALLTLMSINCRIAPLIVKTHNTNGVLADIPLIPPALTGKSIYILRDPRSVAVSFARHLGESHEQVIKRMNTSNSILLDEENYIPVYLSTWTNHVNTWTNTDKFEIMVLRYEDMVSNPTTAFTKILTYYFPQEKINNSAFKKAMQLTKLNTLREKEKKQGFVEASKHNDAFFGDGNNEKWKKQLTIDQIKTIETDHADVMKRYQYL